MPTRLLLAAAVAALWLPGCSNVPPDVDRDIGRQTLRTALSAWQQQQTPDSLRKASPEVIVQDPDWLAGRELVEFEVLDDGQPFNAILRCSVRLKLKDAQGKASEKNVRYDVGTHPVRTVFRSVY